MYVCIYSNTKLKDKYLKQNAYDMDGVDVYSLKVNGSGCINVKKWPNSQTFDP